MWSRLPGLYKTARLTFGVTRAGAECFVGRRIGLNKLKRFAAVE